jgi:hypothetical protein
MVVVAFFMVVVASPSLEWNDCQLIADRSGADLRNVMNPRVCGGSSARPTGFEPVTFGFVAFRRCSLEFVGAR